MYEAIHGKIPGPGAFLTLVLEDPQFAWLRTISTLVVGIDEAMAPRSGADDAMLAALGAQVRELVSLKPDGNEFQVRYAGAVEESDTIRALQRELEAALSNFR